MFHFLAIAIVLFSSQSYAGRGWNSDSSQTCDFGRLNRVFATNEVEPGIIHLVFKDQKTLNTTFMRFQEYYESPKFKGRVFSRKKFKRWYRSEHDGYFTYYQDWVGFNIPDYALDPFLRGEFKKLTKTEKQVLDVFRSREDNFYVIASVEGEKDVVAHEVSHGRFYLNEDYRHDVREAIRKHNTLNIQSWLLKAGYDDSVLPDEINAYVLNDLEELETNMNTVPLRALHVELKRIEADYFKTDSEQK